jgi:hypothetical protein
VTVPAAIRPVLGGYALAVGKRIVALFAEPIAELILLAESDLLVVRTEATRGRGRPGNLWGFTVAGRRRWRVVRSEKGGAGERYFHVGVWSETRLVALQSDCLVVIDAGTGRLVSKIPRRW